MVGTPPGPAVDPAEILRGWETVVDAASSIR
jgi:hypothetical protein